jgi:hypothetical protein
MRGTLTVTTTKTEYYYGEALDKSTITVKRNNIVIDNSECQFTGMNSSVLGRHVIRVSHDTSPEVPGGIIYAEFIIEVKAKTNALSAVTTKGEYHYGEAFDYDSLKVTWFDHTGKAINIPSRLVKIVGFDTTGVGNIDPYVVYKNMTAPINVVESY